MIMADYIAEHLSTVEEVLTEDNLKHYEKQSADKDCAGLRYLMDEGEHVFMPFNNGWIIWKPTVMKNKHTMHIACLYIGRNSKVKGRPLWDCIRTEAKENGCEVIAMETYRDPVIWAKATGFEVTSYRMEYNLGDYNGT